jgi:hypothetical protein
MRASQWGPTDERKIFAVLLREIDRGERQVAWIGGECQRGLFDDLRSNDRMRSPISPPPATNDRAGELNGSMARL